VYLLALDESGTHNGSPVVLIGGLAVHEADVRRVERDLHAVLNKHLVPLGLDPWQHELHATELKTPSKAKRAANGYPATRDSEWLTIPSATRLAVLADAYAVVRDHQPSDRRYPLRIFAAVVERRHKEFATAEKYAYDHVLHRFDEMLRGFGKDEQQRGLVVHDRRDSVHTSARHEPKIQGWTALWQRTGPRLEAIVQVPYFTDSHASRLIQAADFVSYALWRQYSQQSDAYIADLWQHVDIGKKGELSGVIHLTPDFGRCPCKPCVSRTTQAKS
jgi:hypothetical protein